MAEHIAAEHLAELTYEREDIRDISINLKTLERKCPLTLSQGIEGTNDFDAADLPSLGQLDVLPLELVTEVLKLLDLRTLMRMQSLNHRSKFVVNSLPPYSEIVTHAPNALRAMLSTKLAPHFSIDDLCSALRSQACFLCGSFGAFLYLLSCRRCCWICLAEASDARSELIDDSRLSFRIPRNALLQLPCLRSLPGRYSLGGSDGDSHIQRVSLISMKAVKEKEAEIKLNKSQGARELYVTVSHVQIIKPHMTHNCESAYFNNVAQLRKRRRAQNPGRKFLRGPSWSFRDGYDHQRFMAAIRFPTVDPSNGIGEWGISCKGCRDGPPDNDRSRDWEAMYTERGYLAHFDQCKWSGRLMASLKSEGSPVSTNAEQGE